MANAASGADRGARGADARHAWARRGRARSERDRAGIADAPYPEPIPWKGTRRSRRADRPRYVVDVGEARESKRLRPRSRRERNAASGSCGCAGEQKTAAAVPSARARGSEAREAARSSIRSVPAAASPRAAVIRGLVWAPPLRAGRLLRPLHVLPLPDRRSAAASPRKADAPVRLPLPVEGFLLADPFVGAMTLLSTHTVYRGLLWSVGLLALTLVFGRVFCGWICPFGTLHHFFAWILPSRNGRGGHRASRRTRRTPTSARSTTCSTRSSSPGVAGSAIGGLFDPICIAVRSIGLGVIPARAVPRRTAASARRRTCTRAPLQARRRPHAGLPRADRLAVRSSSTSTRRGSSSSCFVAVLFANRFIPRFWCRVLCPLGAFLGVFARFALFGMEKDHAKCTDCNLCLVHCQGAD